MKLNWGSFNRFEPASGHGLIAWLEKTRVVLPLKGVECRFHVCGDLLRVEMDQIFFVDTKGAVDCTYSFPLPACAAVYKCEMHVNGRTVRAQVEEKEKARQLAREHRDAGHRTALVEMERDNLFTLSLGNVQPGDVVVIRLAYFETLTRLADWTSLRIPFSPGVRYVPGQPLLRQARGTGTVDDTDQVPDASRISPPRIDELHPDAAYLFVEGVIDDPLALVKDISSSSHMVRVEDGERQYRVSLASRQEKPSGDFALRWTESIGQASPLRSAAVAVRDGSETYALIVLAGPGAAGAAATATPPQDYYFLVDRSGSMEGLKWQKAVESFRAFLRQLRPEDRAWACFFNGACQDFAERPMSTAEFVEDSALVTLERLGATGGTELLPALTHTFEAVRVHSSGRQAQVILITDGQVGNEEAILNKFQPQADLRLHTFGIDQTANDGFLQKLASRHRGSSCLLQPMDDLVSAVVRLGPRLRSPNLTSLAPGAGWELAGCAIPDLHAEERICICLRAESGDAQEAVLRGRSSDGREDSFRFPLAFRDEPAIRLTWARERIQRLIESGQPKLALELARKHNLVCQGAAFIAWDETEKVPVAQAHLYQPSLRHGLVHYCLCFDSSEASPNRRGSVSQKAVMAGVSVPAPQNLVKAASDFGLVGLRNRFDEAFGLRFLYGGDCLFDKLGRWITDGADDRERRVIALRQLLDCLEKAPENAPAKIDIFVAWVGETFARDTAIWAELLRELERRLELVRQIDEEVAAKVASHAQHSASNINVLPAISTAVAPSVPRLELSNLDRSARLAALQEGVRHLPVELMEFKSRCDGQGDRVTIYGENRHLSPAIRICEQVLPGLQVMPIKAPVPGDVCARGHGTLRSWQGKPRCWTCGWPFK